MIKIAHKTFKNLPLKTSRKPRSSGLNTESIKHAKNESETFSISAAKNIAKKKLGVANADIKVTRVKYLNSSFREYKYRNLVLVKEWTYVENGKQMDERQYYPDISEKPLDIKSESPNIASEQGWDISHFITPKIIELIL